MPKAQKRTGTVRRSVALPRRLIEQAEQRAPTELRGNVNRLVTVALQEYVSSRKAREFEQAMAEMAADPQVRKETAIILKQFSVADADGFS